MAASISIGTAGWSIASVNADLFTPSGTHLERYAGRFSAVEINSSFYRPHRRATYERWAKATPPGFRFSVKLPRAISHERRLAGAQDLIDRFAGEIEGLGDKLGVVLVQLPPSLALEPSIAAEAFRQLQARVSAPFACEPRHASWFTPSAEAFLAERRIARVAADPALAPEGDRPGGWDGLVYWRWHGSPRVYYSAYEADRLEALTRRLGASPAGEQWVIFDNTAAFAAARDAASLQAMIGA